MGSKKEVYKEMEETLGLVPVFFKSIPDNVLDLEWQIFQKVQMDDSAVSQKNRQLIGLGIAGATKCKYCAYMHTEFAKFYGATDEEIENAVHFAKETSGWSTYVNGLQVDFDAFKKDVQNILKYVKENNKVEA